MKKTDRCINCNVEIGWSNIDNFSFAVCSKEECVDVGNKIYEILSAYKKFNSRANDGFTVFCNECGSSDVSVSGDTLFNAHLDCRICENEKIFE